MDIYEYDLGKLSYEDANKIFNYIVSYEQENIWFLEMIDEDLQYKIFTNEDNINNLIKANIKDEYLSKLDGKVISYLLNYNYFVELFLSYDIGLINTIMKKDITLPRSLLCYTLIKKYIDIKDINRYRNYVNNIKDINLKLMVEEAREKEYKNMIDNIDNDLLPVYQELYNKILNNKPIEYFGFYNQEIYYEVLDKINNKDKLLSYLKEVSSKEILEIIVDRYFKDITYNFLINIKSLLLYIDNTKVDLIDKDRLNIYRKIYNYYNLSMEEKKALFYSLNNNIDYMGLFYDDFNVIRRDSYKNIKNKLINLSGEYYKLIDNIPIYYKEGDDFYLLISHTLWDKNQDCDSNVDSNIETYSMSIISHNNLMTFRNPEVNVILGFDMDIDKVIHLYESDSFSNGVNGSDRVQRLFTMEELISNTKGYNEVLIYNNPVMKPSYVVVYDKIGIGDMTMAKKYNIPIVVINTKMYSDDRTKLDVLGDKYEDGYSASYLKVNTYQRMLK